MHDKQAGTTIGSIDIERLTPEERSEWTVEGKAMLDAMADALEEFANLRTKHARLMQEVPPYKDAYDDVCKYIQTLCIAALITNEVNTGVFRGFVAVDRWVKESPLALTRSVHPELDWSIFDKLTHAKNLAKAFKAKWQPKTHNKFGKN